MCVLSKIICTDPFRCSGPQRSEGREAGGSLEFRGSVVYRVTLGVQACGFVRHVDLS